MHWIRQADGDFMASVSGDEPVIIGIGDWQPEN
jgi:hypothetical protein